MKIYHQIGHNGCWNVTSFNEDSVGDLIILSPKNMNATLKKKLTGKEKLAEKALFDPQMYRPQRPHQKLLPFDYYEKIASKARREEYLSNADMHSINGLSTQEEYATAGYIIPTIDFENVTIEDIDYISETFIDPYLENRELLFNPDKPIYATIILTSSILDDENLYNHLLSLITSYDALTGIYLIPKFHRKGRRKRIESVEYLTGVLNTIKTLKENDLEVIVGYTDIEGALYAIAEPDGITLGSYENLRIFQEKPFEFQTNDGGGQGIPRIYSSKLFQWINSASVEEMLEEDNAYLNLFDNNKYLQDIIDKDFDLNTHSSAPYKHYFISYSNQIKRISELKSIEEKANYLKKKLKEAARHYSHLSDDEIMLPEECSSVHLSVWNATIKKFTKNL